MNTVKKYTSFVFLILVMIIVLLLTSCDLLKEKFQDRPAHDTTALECPTKSCNKEFAVPDEDTDLRNPADSASLFLAEIKQQYPDVVALYAGAYQADSQQTTLEIPYIDRPVILYLTSYHAINWKLSYINKEDNPEKKTNIVGIVYGSYDDGTQVIGFPKDMLFNSGLRGSYDSKSDCSCAGGNFHCNGSDVIQDIGRLQHKYGIQVLDYAGDYSTSYLTFNNTNTPLNFAIAATQNYQKLEAKKNQCIARTNPNYESLYQNKQSKISVNDIKELKFHDDTKTYVIENNPNIQDLEFDSHLYKFPLTTSTWGDFLNPERKVPNTGFVAYYINADDPKNIIEKEQVTDIQKKFAYDEFLGIPSQSFNAYWVGVLKVPTSEFYNVLMNKSWSGGRVTIDRRVVLEKGKHDIEEKVFLPAGEHIVEVEYSNGWHTTDMQVIIEALSSVKQAKDPNGFLNKIKQKYPNVKGLYAGVYEASNKAVVLDIPKSQVPIVLYLGSYHSVKWQINNPNNTKIVGVIYGSYDNGTKVQGVPEDRVINTGKQLGSYKSSSGCDSKSKLTLFDIPVFESVGEYSTDYLKFCSKLVS